MKNGDRVKINVYGEWINAVVQQQDFLKEFVFRGDDGELYIGIETDNIIKVPVENNESNE